MEKTNHVVVTVEGFLSKAEAKEYLQEQTYIKGGRIEAEDGWWIVSDVDLDIFDDAWMVKVTFDKDTNA